MKQRRSLTVRSRRTPCRVRQTSRWWRTASSESPQSRPRSVAACATGSPPPSPSEAKQCTKIWILPLQVMHQTQEVEAELCIWSNDTRINDTRQET